MSLFVFFNQQIKMVTNTNVFLFSSNGTDFIGFVDLPVSLVFAFLQKLKRYSDRCFTKDFYKENKFLKPLFVMSMLVALSILYLHFLALWAICVPKLFRKQLASLHHK